VRTTPAAKRRLDRPARFTAAVRTAPAVVVRCRDLAGAGFLFDEAILFPLILWPGRAIAIVG